MPPIGSAQHEVYSFRPSGAGRAVLRRFLLAVALSLLAPCAVAAAADPLFESHDTLQVRITGPLRTLSRDRDQQPEERPGEFAYRAADGSWRTFEIELEPRGKSRRVREVCQFPPLRLDFRRKDVGGSLLDGQNKLKLVTHCRRSSRHDEYVFKEYLAYRLLATLTDTGFRVRPLDIEYVDTDRDNRTERRFGFFIEDVDRLAHRLGLEHVEPGRISPDQLAPEHGSLIALFQYMIGNTDFSFIAPADDDDAYCHNLKLLEDADGGYWPIPYDFDISGFVDPPYAMVDGQLPIRDVRQRLYRGFCWQEAVMNRTVAHFQQARGSLFEVVARETALEERDRDRVQRYLERFFAVLDDPDELADDVLHECRDSLSR